MTYSFRLRLACVLVGWSVLSLCAMPQTALSQDLLIKARLKTSNVTISPVPLVTLTSPAPDAVVPRGGSVTITAVPVEGVQVESVLFVISGEAPNTALIEQPPFTVTFPVGEESAGFVKYMVLSRDSAKRVWKTEGKVNVQ